MLYFNYISIFKNEVVQQLRMPYFIAEAKVLSLVKELRSHMPHGMAKKKKKKWKDETAQVLDKGMD